MRSAVLLLLILGVALGSASAAAEDAPRVLFLFPSMGAMGSEFFDAHERLEERGVVADVAAGVTGPYTFWEDSAEGRAYGVPGGYSLDIELAIADVKAEIYDAILVGPAFAHAFWFEPGNQRGLEIINEAAARGTLIGGISWGVWVILGQGLLDGRMACDWPHPLGVVSPPAHWAGFLSTFDVAGYTEECLHIDEGRGGEPTIVTANYRCPAAFADTIADLLLGED